MRIKNIFYWLIQGILFLLVLVILPVLWIIQFLVFLPLLLITFFVSRKTDIEERHERRVYVEPNKDSKDPLIFNRVNDISKIYGCNTRNVKYRWNIFNDAIQSLKLKSDSDRVLTALDFGAGSLVDSYELAKLGFKVDAIDLNAQALNTYKGVYDWNSVPITPNIESISLFELEKNKEFDLIVAFDVLEHLHNLEDYIVELRNRLAPGGIIIVTVPNKRSVFETCWAYGHKQRISRNLPVDTSGASHVQFKTPEEWDEIFKEKGLKILKHDMGIGFLVNDCWHGFYGLAVRRFIEPFIISIITRTLKIDYAPYSFEEIFYPYWLMERVNVIDLALKPLLKHRWGWNLFVLSNNKSRKRC